MTACVGIDLHRRRSLAVCLDEGGERLWWKRFENSPQTLVEAVRAAGPDPEVVLEATWGWHWAVDVLADEEISDRAASRGEARGSGHRRCSGGRRALGPSLRQ
jgi:hypothetical protein